PGAGRLRCPGSAIGGALAGRPGAAAVTVVERRWRRRLVARDRAALEAMRPIVREPDAPFAPGAGRVLQRALAQQVARFELAGHDLVLKRYQARDFGTRVRRLVTPSRAARSWRGALRL